MPFSILSRSESDTIKQRLLSSDETMATTIHAILLDRFGEPIYGYEPLTVALEIKDEFGVDPSTAVMDKWCAIQTVMSSDAFFSRIDAFLSVCNTLSSGSPMFDVFDPVTPEEAAWGITEVSMNRDMLPFSPTIRDYVRLILKNEGFDSSTFPYVFKQVFEKDPDEKKIRGSIATLGNDSNINRFIIENSTDIENQLNEIPDLKYVDDVLLRSGLEKALHVNKAALSG